MAEKKEQPQPEVVVAPVAPPAAGGYRLKADVGPHRVEGKQVEPGTVVQLSATQAVAFRDKFEQA